MANADSRISVLRMVPGFAELSDAELAGVARAVDYCDIPDGTVLFREGSTGELGFVVIEGYAAVSLRGELMEAIGPGELLGDPGTRGPRERATTVTAKTSMRVLVIGPEAFEAARGSRDARVV